MRVVLIEKDPSACGEIVAFADLTDNGEASLVPHNMQTYLKLS